MYGSFPDQARSDQGRKPELSTGENRGIALIEYHGDSSPFDAGVG